MGNWQWADSKFIEGFMVDGKKNLDKAIAAVPQEDLSRCMAYFVDENGCWKWDKFKHLLPVASCLKIAGIKPPSILFFRRLVNKPNPVDSGYATSHRKLG